MNKLKEQQQTEKGISDIVGALADPIIVYPGGWGDILPGWLKGAITLERMAVNLRALKGDEEMTGTDAEACAYLYTANLTNPMDSDWADIFFYVTTQVYNRYYSKGDGARMPEDLQVESISDYQMGELRRLKGWIYQRRVRDRQDRDRAERREQRQKEAVRKKAERPTLFEF